MRIVTDGVQRSEWQAKVTAAGIPSLERQAPDGRRYLAWDESYAYELPMAEADGWFAQAEEVVRLLASSQAELFASSFQEFGYPPAGFAFAKEAFEAQHPDLFTRYDFLPTKDGKLKLVAVAADSVRYVVATSHVQLQWLAAFNGEKKAQHLQINTFKDDVVERLRKLRALSEYGILHVVNGTDTHNDDWIGAVYLKNAAQQAGWETATARESELRWHHQERLWFAPGGVPVTAMLKTSSWDSIFRGEQARDFIDHTERLELLLEPAWKTITSNRGIFPLLHRLHPTHPNLLRMTREPGALREMYAAASEFSSGQAEIASIKGKQVKAFGETRELSALARKVYRNLPDVASYVTPQGKRYPIISFTAVGQEISAMAIRDEPVPLIGNYSVFHPHYVVKDAAP